MTQRRHQSIYTGVCLTRDKRKFRVELRHNGKCYCLGNFGSEEHAARAYDMKSLELRGAKARLNFPLADYQEGGAYYSHRPEPVPEPVPEPAMTRSIDARQSQAACHCGCEQLELCQQHQGLLEEACLGRRLLENFDLADYLDDSDRLAEVIANLLKAGQGKELVTYLIDHPVIQPFLSATFSLPP